MNNAKLADSVYVYEQTTEDGRILEMTYQFYDKDYVLEKTTIETVNDRKIMETIKYKGLYQCMFNTFVYSKQKVTYYARREGSDPETGWDDISEERRNELTRDVKGVLTLEFEGDDIILNDRRFTKQNHQ